MGSEMKGFTPLEAKCPAVCRGNEYPAKFARAGFNVPRQLLTGFTLIEIMLSVALIGVLAGLSVSVYYSLQIENDLDIAANAVSQSLRRAQILSRAVAGDANWGVKAQSGGVILFKGASYAGRDAAFDETFETASGVVFSGLQEIVFSRLLGEPQTTGTTTLTASSGETRSVFINSKGAVFD